MIHRRYKKLSTWLMVALLLGAATASGAQGGPGGQEPDSAGEIRLHLAEALSFEQAQISFRGDESPAGPEVAQRARISELSLAAARDAWSSLQQAEAAEDEAAPKKRGRWLKKHWYVPVLIAGAVGALAASGGDDDSTGEDD